MIVFWKQRFYFLTAMNKTFQKLLRNIFFLIKVLPIDTESITSFVYTDIITTELRNQYGKRARGKNHNYLEDVFLCVAKNLRHYGKGTVFFSKTTLQKDVKTFLVCYKTFITQLENFVRTFRFCLIHFLNTLGLAIYLNNYSFDMIHWQV